MDPIRGLTGGDGGRRRPPPDYIARDNPKDPSQGVPEWILPSEAAFLTGRSEASILRLAGSGRIGTRALDKHRDDPKLVLIRARDLLDLEPSLVATDGGVDLTRELNAPAASSPARDLSRPRGLPVTRILATAAVLVL